MNPDVYQGPWGGANCRDSVAQVSKVTTPHIACSWLLSDISSVFCGSKFYIRFLFLFLFP